MNPLSRLSSLVFAAFLTAGIAQALPPAGAASSTTPDGPWPVIIQQRGVWWFRSADGKRFLSRGVNCVGPGPSATEYDPANPQYSTFVHVRDTYAEWEKRTLGRLRSWGFNTIGGWSDSRLYETPFYSIPFLNYQVFFGSIWFDLWAADYEAKAMEAARKITAPYRDNRRVIGYWLDNEFGWGDDYFLSLYLEYPDWMGERKKAPGKKKLIEFLKNLYQGDFRLFMEDFSTNARDWDGLFSSTATGRRPGRGHKAIDGWMEEIGRRYYGIAVRSLKAADPHHILVGDRFRQYYPQGIARAARGLMDVVSTNYEATTTDGWISPVYFETLHELSGCPIIVGEFYATARQNRSGNRNSGGEFTLTDTQAERAAAAAAQVRRYAAFPFVVGWHWFQFSDEPTYGRNDSEDYNMGLVDIYDMPYPELVRTFASINAAAETIHARSAAPRRKPKIPLRISQVQDNTLVADGRLGEWNKSSPVHRSLLATPEGVAPFADVFLCWDKGNLWLAIRAYDFSYPQKLSPAAADPGTWGEMARLRLRVESTTVMAATGLVFAEGRTDGNRVTFVAPPPRGQASAAVSSHVDSWYYIWEIAVPAAALGRSSFKPGSRFNISIEVENRGDLEKLSIGGGQGLEVVLNPRD